MVYDEIKDAARTAGRTMGEELVWRATHYAEWRKAVDDARAIVAQANKTAALVTKQTLQAELRKAGHTYVRGINGGAWFDPGVASIKWIADSLPQELVEELMARAVTRGVKLAREEERS